MTRPPYPANTDLEQSSLIVAESDSSPSRPGNGGTSQITRVLGSKSPLYLALGTVDVDMIEPCCDCSWGCSECDPTEEFKP